MNESFWDAQNVEIEACAKFGLFPIRKKLPSRNKIVDSMLWGCIPPHATPIETWGDGGGTIAPLTLKAGW